MTTLVRNAEIDGRSGRSVRVDAERIHDIGDTLTAHPGERVIDAAGGALIPGLHDHHVHLRAAAAARLSVSLETDHPFDADNPLDALREADRENEGGGWLRAVGYHEPAGAPVLDRARLDAAVPGRPVRVQHRSGALWVFNSAAIEQLGETRFPAAAERDEQGRLTGRVWRADDWLRDVMGPRDDSELKAALAGLGAQAAARGVTGFTDATPDTGQRDLDTAAEWSTSGLLPQQLTFLAALGSVASGPVGVGPRKFVIDDPTLPDGDEFAAEIRRTHAAGRAVAVHCVTIEQLAFALAALAAAGAGPGGDRIEHGSLVPPAFIDELRRLGLTVVTQPGFVAGRGDDYLRDVPADEQDWLYPCGLLLAAGVPVAGSTDQPFGPDDPWLAIRTAISRAASSGRPVAPHEAVDAATALNLFLGDAMRPGIKRTVSVGASGDLCLLRVPLADALQAPSADLVAGTICGGTVLGCDDLR